MQIRWDKGAQKDFNKLDKQLKQEIKSEIEELRQTPFPKNSTVIQLFNGEQVQRLKIQEEDRNSRLNHRVLYDIEGDTIYIYGVWHREAGYTQIKEEAEHRKG